VAERNELTTTPRTIAALAAALALISTSAPSLASPLPWQAARQRAAEGRPPQQLNGLEPGGGGSAAVGGGAQFTPLDLPAGAFGPADAGRTHKLDTELEALAQAHAQRGAAAAALYAHRHGIAWNAGAVLVRLDAGLPLRGVRLRDASSRAIVDQALAELAPLGVRVRNVIGPHIEAWVAVERLAALEAIPSLRAVRMPWKMRAHVTSEGRAAIGADRWDDVKFRSPIDGLKVGVIDLGFEGFEALKGRELPGDGMIFTRSFRDDGDIEADDDHGTAVAEIVYDVEPEAWQYLAAVETVGDISEAVDYMLQNGVDVINMSLGCVGCGPGNGNGAVVEVVEKAPQAGVPFVTSAGNEANRHWIGSFVDADGDGFHEFAPGDESNAFAADAGDEVFITMNWDFPNWFASSQDFDLLLLDSLGNIVDQSRFRQAGFAGQEATEEIAITLPFSDTFQIVIQRIQASLPETVEIYVEIDGLQYVVADRSLSLPADGREVFAVGAAHWASGLPETFSSRGPTKDGRLKPDMAAPDGVSTASFGPMSFFGTSAASPHVVGAVALLRGRLGLLSGADAFSVLVPRLIDVPPVGPDNITGRGRLSLILP